MKTKLNPLFFFFVVALAAGVCLAFVGCVSPYDAPGHPGQTAGYVPDTNAIEHLSRAIHTAANVAGVIPQTAPFSPLIDLAGTLIAGVVSAVSVIVARRKSAVIAAVVNGVEKADSPAVKTAIQQSAIAAGVEPILSAIVEKQTATK